MQSDAVPSRPKTIKSWRKVSKRISGLYQYRPTGMYHARVRYGGKLYRESLETEDLQFAKRKLAVFKQRLGHTDPRRNKTTLVTWLEENYFPTLRGSPGALKAKQRIIAKVKAKWFFARTQPMRDIKESQVLTFLNEHFGGWSESYWNSALTVLRDAFNMAVKDHVIMENPAGALKYRRRKKPIRLTPSFEQFNRMVADIRAQTYNADAEESGDFVEFLGLAGLGQAEAAAIKREHVDLDAGRIHVYRQKTDTEFWIPIYPQLRPLVEKLCNGKKHDERLFTVNQARKAITNACKRLDFPIYTHRALRRMFITRAIERGVDVKTLADWQGHKDGGKLILETYSHVRSEHAQRMAQLMTTEQPANVIPISAEA
ncbi:MAG TPA: tyrosine-type recombinase/integrase [Candidatus Udaeobacter sp.]|nr:tyrosine-type recombinase/integrase [Candidatus Udaeobacter sp.]